MPAAILICDDEPEIRAAMRRTLRGYDVTEAAAPAQAVALIKSKHFDAIVSDFAMGDERDGLDLLGHVRLMYPEMVRFLVTANRDLDIVVRAVNEGSVHRYFAKPWHDDQLRAALDIMLRSRLAANVD